ncbi:MAG: glycine cleavage system aminomethyltransferase GcvT [candidate division WOR-3 bacterium]
MRTPFYDFHCQWQGKMIDFFGFEMPLYYQGIIPEHLAVRNSCGLFDVSHMGRVEIRGKDAINFVDFVTTNAVKELKPYQAQYSVFCYESGGIVDDLVVYNLEDHFLLVVNASNREKDINWLKKNLSGEVEIIDRTFEIAQLALQGPKAEEILGKITNSSLSEIKFYWAKRVKVAEVECLVSRTGYTGEDGFELYFSKDEAPKIWPALFNAGKEFNLVPCGLGARNTLRLEMRYCLYGNDITAETDPLSAGLGFVVKLNKGDFIGKPALEGIKKGGLKRKLVGFEVAGERVAREHFKILNEKREEIGFVTSGSFSPSLKKPIGLGYVAIEYSEIGTPLFFLSPRGEELKGVVVKTPFYKMGSLKRG